MNCVHFKNSIFDFIDGNLSAKKLKAMNDHLANCTDCRTFLSKENLLKSSMEKIFEKETESLVLSSDIVAKIKLSTKSKKQNYFDLEKLTSVVFGFFSPRFAMAAVTISVIIFSFLFVKNLNNKKQFQTTKNVDCIQQYESIASIETEKKSLPKEKVLKLQPDQTLQETEKPDQNVVDKKFVEINGIVRDSKLMTEIDDVEIVCVSPSNKFADARWSDFTDENGKFQMTVASEELNFEFRHPDYAPVRKYFSSADNKRTPTVELSKGGDVLVCVSPKEKNDCIVKLIGNYKDLWLYRTKLSEMFSEKPDEHGNVLFKNVPSHLPSVKVEIFDEKSSNKIAYTETFFIKPDDTKVININLDSAKLIVRFSESIEGKKIFINIIKNKKRFYKNNFLSENNDYILPNVEEGFYEVIIKNRVTLCHQTNIFVSGIGNTILEIDNKIFDKMNGVIKGKIISKSKKLPLIKMHVSENKNQDFFQNGIHIITDSLQIPVSLIDKNFIVRNLNVEKKYDVVAEIKGLTNIIVKSVQPNGEEIEIILPEGYRVTGSVKNKEGKELKGSFWLGDLFCGRKSEINFFPVVPGDYLLKIKAEGFLVKTQKVTVISQDIDLGEILLVEKEPESMLSENMEWFADDFSVSPEKIYNWEGNVEIKFGDYTFKSPHVTYDKKSLLMIADGPAKITYPEGTDFGKWTAKKMSYNSKNNVMEFNGNARLKIGDKEIISPSVIVDHTKREITLDGPIKFSTATKQSTENVDNN